MSVFRVEKNKGYTVMSNHHLRNHTLSLKAKGLLSQIEPFPIWWTRKSEKKLNEILSILRPVQAATEAQRRASKRSGGIQPRAECGRTVL